jgi:hypothetical protein
MPSRSPRRAAPRSRSTAAPQTTTPPLPTSVSDPDSPSGFSFSLPTPDRLSDDDVASLADDIGSLTSGRGWRWLVQYANDEWGSKATRARLYSVAARNGDGVPPDLATLGAAVNAELAATDAIQQLLNAPTRLLTSLRIEARRRSALRNQEQSR